VATSKRERQRVARERRREIEAKAAKRKSTLRRVVVVVLVAGLVIGSIYLFKGGSSTTSTTTTTTASGSLSSAQIAAAQTKANKVSVAAGCPASTSARANTMAWKSAPAMTIDPTKTYLATVTTDLGNFVITLDASKAPQTVNNFVFLSQQGYYHCVVFHRVIQQFMDQTGDPTGTGTGGPGYTIPDENPAKSANATLQYPLGSVAMANTGAANSGGSQFFIVTGPEGESLPNSYALFGLVTSGLKVVETINQQGSSATNGGVPVVTHRILSISIAAK
jgi:cyclophilin family peptidyl-prolyl cis-trans isomerase